MKDPWRIRTDQRVDRLKNKLNSPNMSGQASSQPSRGQGFKVACANKERVGGGSWRACGEWACSLAGIAENALSIAPFHSQRSQTSSLLSLSPQTGQKTALEVAQACSDAQLPSSPKSPSEKSCVCRLTGDSRKPPEAHHFCWVYLRRSSPSAFPVLFLFRRALRRVWPRSDPRTMTPISSPRSSESSIKTR
jgi:hypothetical protein